MTHPIATPFEVPEHELRRRFAVRVERFVHSATILEVLLPTSADALIDAESFDLDERLPYWAELWPAGRALAGYLLDEDVPPATRILELGCGVGLPSLALASRGHRVLATDYYEDALAFTLVNARRNGIPGVGVALLDWRDTDAIEPVDLVLAADVFYEKRNAVALAARLPTLLRPGGRAMLADPGRVYLANFRAAVQKDGWVLRELDERTELSDPATGAVSRVSILCLER